MSKGPNRSIYFVARLPGSATCDRRGKGGRCEKGEWLQCPGGETIHPLPSPSAFESPSAFGGRNRYLDLLYDRETLVVREERFRFLTDGSCNLNRVRGRDAVSGAQVRGGFGDICIERHHGEVRKRSQQVPIEGDESCVSRLAGSREDLVKRQDRRHRPEPPRLDLLEQALREGDVCGVFLEVINEDVRVQSDDPLALRRHPDSPPGGHSQDSRSRRRKRSAPTRERQASFPRPRKAFAKDAWR